ncbi:tyrosine-type recombinase/integrase [Legionella sp. D16C41]|uniref:tyrosine-type recombinase/integrase n=1 Tax=Legionella sp. D16C41 TaxID=3402688 RepID=UPI003AF6B4F0
MPKKGKAKVLTDSEFKRNGKVALHQILYQSCLGDCMTRRVIIGASSHLGRRIFTTKLIEQGVNIKAVSRLASHASIVTTSIYVDDNFDRLK